MPSPCPSTVNLQASFGPLNSTSACHGNASVLLLVSLFLFPHPIHFFFAFQFSQEFPVQPYCPPCYGCLGCFCEMRLNFSCELKRLSSKADPVSRTALPFKSFSCFVPIYWIIQILLTSRGSDRSISSSCLKKISSTPSILLGVP